VIPNSQFCPHCGAPMAVDAPSGLCPRCVLGLGFAAVRPDEPAETKGEQPLAAAAFGPNAVNPASPSGAGGGERSPSVWATASGAARRSPPPAPAELAAFFPQLEILELIGQGGMGAVYKARQRGLDRLVALKILPPATAEDPAFAERFHREARALARLSHPHIVSVFDSGLAGPYFYFVMEYVDGVNLRQAMQVARLEARETLNIIPQICDALQYAHDEGVVHRDIKPENILVDRKGRVKVADFGLAKLLTHEPLDVTLTGTFQVVGTPRYMAPEQLGGARDIDHRADIYSLGVVFYELLTNELPLGRFPVPSQRSGVNAKLDDIVLRTLEREPAQRYQRASELKVDVEQVSAVRNVLEENTPSYRNSSIAGITPDGYDYRSDSQLFGWPLVHVVKGIDPQTGRERVAKGIIAVGPTAYGGLAIGGRATGILAIGGIAHGLVAVGGVALGGFALGGVALGLGFALGGVAVGLFAVGGAALGLSAEGGAAIGMQRPSFLSSALGFGAPSPGFARAELAMMSLIFIILGVSTAVSVLAYFSGKKRREQRRAAGWHSGPQANRAFQAAELGWTPPAAPPVATAVHRQGNAFPGWGWVLVFSLLCCPCAVLVPLGFLMPVRMATVANPAMHGAMQHQHTELTWTDQGPRVDGRLQEFLGWTSRHASLVNGAIDRHWREYLEIEKKLKTARYDELGHYQVHVAPMPGDQLSKLEHQFWSDLDQHLNSTQQQQARNYIKTTSHSEVNSLVQRPATSGVFGWGRAGVDIEIWRVGRWYHYRVETPAKEAKPQNGITFTRSVSSGSGPTLPRELARFAPPAEPSESRAEPSDSGQAEPPASTNE
jgi:hypothetical protein